MASGNDAEGFSLDNESGELTVSTSSILDFETTPTFNLGIEVSDGSLSDLAIFTISLTDVEEDEEEEETLSLADASAMIYPNPSNGIVNIKIVALKEATIYNLSSKRIMRSTDNRLDVSALSEGVYTIKLENRSGDRFSTRLIKE
ncbi:T9SS type A sorting domain-containing protein [Cyclobacteriaceae bacterium]|nr:T9SS type A sorting domain-containing protein [Cyclobacteriaceae bacterium]MDA8889520.1 T9SS type A sorting domain-containing protein [Cyclobacteriaceae bacterium]